MLELTEQQRLAVTTSPRPPRLVDPKTQKTYVLVGEETYERMQRVFEDVDPSLYEFEEIDPR